jgi:hypothetical protein
MRAGARGSATVARDLPANGSSAPPQAEAEQPRQVILTAARKRRLEIRRRIVTRAAARV